MPVYEYVCKSCQHEFEELVFGSNLPSCPQCEGEKLDKRVSTFGVGHSQPGGSPPALGPAPGPGPCGSCGAPEGPGSCSPN
ncbi:MAG TPA: zinc ribbon domain-containing protein [Planctomycetes bacterium]|nr:zinc ribbon domain-containing protein [Planctomycetota bacterium]HIK59411.1 zinc ribbon domain-containing protein [Planctomycetota bacterium]